AVQSVQFLQLPDDGELTYLLGLFNSMAFDHLVRSMIPGIDLTQSVIRQIPVPDVDSLQREVDVAGSRKSLLKHIVTCVERLLVHDPDSVAFVNGAKASAQPLSEKTHLGLIDQLDELFYLAYELSPAEIERVRADFSRTNH